MAIAFAEFTNGGVATTYSHTTSGTNRYLFVGITGGTTNNVTAVTYSGVSMTQVGTTQQRPSSRYVYLYGLVAPASGANNVVITINGGDIGQSFAFGYTGAKQATPISGVVNSSGTQANIAQSVTTTDDNSIAFIYAGTGAPQTVGAGTTKRTNADYDNAYDSGNTTITPAGAYTLNITFTNEGFGLIAGAIAPEVAATSGKNFLSMMGIGQ